MCPNVNVALYRTYITHVSMVRRLWETNAEQKEHIFYLHSSGESGGLKLNSYISNVINVYGSLDINSNVI